MTLGKGSSLPDVNIPTSYPIGTPTVNTAGLTRRVRDLQGQINDRPVIELVNVVSTSSTTIGIQKIGTTTTITGVVPVGWSGKQRPVVGDTCWVLYPFPGATPIAIGVSLPTQPRVKVYLTIDVGIGANVVPGNVLFFDGNWAEEYKELCAHDFVTNNSRLTVLHSGLYLIHACITYAGNNTGQRGTGLMVNGTVIVEPFDTAPNGLLDSVVSFALPYELNANDYLEMAYVQNSGGALNIRGGRAKTFLSAVRIADID